MRLVSALRRFLGGEKAEVERAFDAQSAALRAQSDEIERRLRDGGDS